MKNKMKKLLAVFVAILTFVTIAVVDVRAAEVTETFVFDSEAELPKVDKNSSGTGSSIDETTGGEMKLDIENKMTGGSIAWNSSECEYFNRKSTSAEEYASFTFTTKGSGSVTLKNFTTQSDSKYANLSLTNSANVTQTSRVAVKGVDQTFSFTGADTYVLKIAGDSTQSSNLKFNSLIITQTYSVGSSDEVIVLFDSNGGSAIDSQTIKINSSAVEPENQPTKKGYSFDGWYTQDGTNDEWGTKFDFTSTIDSSITLYAKWTKNSSEWCTISFDTDGGASIASTEQIYGSEYMLPIASKDGYSFGGWTDGTNTYVNTYTVPSQATITLTALWDEIIVFDESISFESGTSHSFFKISGNTATNKGSATFNGETYTTVLKMESTTSFTFTLTNVADIYIVFTSADKQNCKIDGTKYTAETNGVLVKNLVAGEHSITKGDTANVAFVGVVYNKMSNNVTGTFEAQYNAETAADSTKLRFIGTIAGVSDTANIASIQFKFTFNGTDRTGNVTSLYTSINSGEAVIKAAADNTYYVVYTLNNINKEAYKGLELSNLELVITFTDGSTVTAVHDSITLPEFTTVQ